MRNFKNKTTVYKVKSITNQFSPFTIEDNGLGYLPLNIEEYVLDKHGILIYDNNKGYKTIRVQPRGDKRWYKIKNLEGSSEEILVEDYKPKIIRW